MNPASRIPESPEPASASGVPAVCPRCGTALGAEAAAVCPACGLALPAAADTRAPGAAAARSLRPHRVRAVLLLGTGAVLIFVLSLGGAAYGGWRAALGDRRAQADEHYQKGLVQLEGGHPELASREFEYVRELVPDYPGIDERILAANATLVAALTPTITPTPAPSATPVPVDLAALLAQAQAYYDAGKYDDTISQLRRIQAADAAYRLKDVRALMYSALRAGGLERLDQDRLEEGLFYLEQAAAIQALDAEAEQARAQAAMYVTASSYWEVDWQEAIARFTELYRTAPFYKDVAVRLFDAYVAYGDQFAGAQDWCPAQEQYAEAERLRYDAAVEQKRIGASQGCLTATPTPMPGMTGTLTLTVTPPAIAGFAGTLAYAAINPASGVKALYTLNSANMQPVQVDVAAGQPSLRRDGGMLAYASPAGVVGIFVVPAAGGVPQLIYEGAASYPTWSPDGGRIAFAAQGDAGTWDIFVIPADGSQPPKRIERGWAPVWGPNGVLAFGACEDGGAVCGIFVDNPDDDTPPVRLTGDPDDVPSSWSPDGQNLAYMSDHGGSWDVLVLNMSGGVVQLTSDAAIEAIPAWSSDGGAIAFLSNRDGAWGVYLMRFDGQEQRKIIDLGVNDPGWRTERLAWR